MRYRPKLTAKQIGQVMDLYRSSCEDIVAACMCRVVLGVGSPQPWPVPPVFCDGLGRARLPLRCGIAMLEARDTGVGRVT